MQRYVGGVFNSMESMDAFATSKLVAIVTQAKELRLVVSQREHQGEAPVNTKYKSLTVNATLRKTFFIIINLC